MDDISITGTVANSIREMVQQDEQSLKENLKESFVSAAVLALFHARRDAGFTQAQVAERMNTTQSAIARLENDLSGSLSLRRYVDYSLACGVAPLDITLEPIAKIRDYVLLDPNAPRTPGDYFAWQATSSFQFFLANNRPAPETIASVSAQTTQPTILNANEAPQQVTPPSAALTPSLATITPTHVTSETATFQQKVA